MTIVDAHLHVFVEESAQYPRDPSAYKPSFDPAPVDLLLAHMDRNNIKFCQENIRIWSLWSSFWIGNAGTWHTNF